MLVAQRPAAASPDVCDEITTAADGAADRSTESSGEVQGSTAALISAPAIGSPSSADSEGGEAPSNARSVGAPASGRVSQAAIGSAPPLSRGPRKTSVIPPRRPVNDSDDRSNVAPSGLWAPNPRSDPMKLVRPAGPLDVPAEPERALHVGRGVPWLTARRPVPARLGRPTWRSRLAVNVGLGLVIVLVVAGYAWWRLDQPLRITAVSVTVQKHVTSACALEADIVGTVITGGGDGTFKYQWRRSDGTTTKVYTARVADPSKPTEVHLRWTFSGVGEETAQVALIVLGPQRRQASTSFEYICAG